MTDQGANPDKENVNKVDRLLDAIDLIKANRREEARLVLRELIREDNNFEDAWLWMSVAVDSLDQSSLSLENALRVNPHNYDAAGALYRIRVPEIQTMKRRTRLRWWRDTVYTLFWILSLLIVLAVMITTFQGGNLGA